MEIFKIENLSFAYPDSKTNALYNINLSVNEGEFVTLCGKSGCGKTTLLRLLKSSLSPEGTKIGNIFYNDTDLYRLSHREDTKSIGFVFQNSEFQICCDKVWHELAFGLESLGLSKEEMHLRVSETASFFGISNLFHKRVCELSGGQKQLLCLASVMVMKPKVLLLDEPTSSLDPISARHFLECVKKVNTQMGVTVIISEHRLSEVLPMSDKVIVMDEGTVFAVDEVKSVAKLLFEERHEMFSAFPSQMRIYACVENNKNYPLTVKDGKLWFSDFASTHEIHPERIPDDCSIQVKQKAIEIKDVHFRYEKNSKDVLKGLSLDVIKGEIFSVLGSNGVGKSTLLSVISSLKKQYRGKVLTSGKLSFLPQDVTNLFVKDSIRDDLFEITNDENLILHISEICNISNLLHKHPYDLSGGESQRAALCKVLLTKPDVLLLDEPTKGMDAHFKKQFASLLHTLKNKGVTILNVSHDIEFCAEVSDRCALMFDGTITAIASPRSFFTKLNYYTTDTVRIAKEILPSAVTVKDVITATGGNEFNSKSGGSKNNIDFDFTFSPKEKKEKKIFSFKSLILLSFILFTVTLTVYSGIELFDDRQYYFISFLVLAQIFLPFFFIFEKRKPKAREIVTIAVLSAICVAGRSIFFMVPQFKPVAAIIIITGACLGYESAMIVGAVSAFVSNLFFGQGPWTIWQMTSFALIGLVSGIVFQTFKIKKSRISMCILGFFSVLILYGGILNCASVFMLNQNPSGNAILASLAFGFPFDLIHALSTVIFLFVLAKPFIKKIERIKKKYGLLNN